MHLDLKKKGLKLFLWNCLFINKGKIFVKYFHQELKSVHMTSKITYKITYNLPGSSYVWSLFQTPNRTLFFIKLFNCDQKNFVLYHLLCLLWNQSHLSHLEHVVIYYEVF